MQLFERKSAKKVIEVYQHELTEQKRQLTDLQELLTQKSKRCDELEADNKRVYAGHASMEEEINFLKFRIQKLIDLHESVTQKTWPHDGSMKEHMCVYPFERIEILPRGEVYTCCSGYIRHNLYIGNIYEESFEDIWNSERCKKLRFSVAEGNFEYCQANCKWLQPVNIESQEDSATLNPIKKREEWPARYVSWEDCHLDTSPKFITLTCDESCNLSCPTCRSSCRALDKGKAEKLYERLNTVVRPMLKDCELLGGLASGDLFASYAATKFYKTLTHGEFPKLKLYILTNLQLLTAKKWDEMSNLKDMPIRLGVSIDAASKQTYEVNRRGASWERLLENLRLIQKMRHNKEILIEFMCFHFVVQKNNYLQMMDFVKLGEKYGADTVEFQRLGNWGMFSEDEYLDRDVFNAQNSYYKEARGILSGLVSEQASFKVHIMQNLL